MLLSLLCGMIVGNLCLKNLVMRPRPCWIDASVPLLIPVPHDYSFPSGHTLAAFETAVSIFLVNRKWGTAFLIFAALHRTFQNVPVCTFPTDVLSGAALGIFIAWFVKKGIEKYRLCDILRVTKKQESRVGDQALSAGWTGSCQPDEKEIFRNFFAVGSPHPAASSEYTAVFPDWRTARNYLPGAV